MMRGNEYEKSQSCSSCTNSLFTVDRSSRLKCFSISNREMIFFFCSSCYFQIVLKSSCCLSCTRIFHSRFIRFSTMFLCSTKYCCCCIRGRCTLFVLSSIRPRGIRICLLSPRSTILEAQIRNCIIKYIIISKMFKTLDDLKKDSKDPKKKETSSYTGGEKSGLAVENPEDRKNIESILSQAEQNSQQPKDGKSETNCKITLYANGFQVDDGEFRDYAQAQNKKFVEELKSGRVPTELRSKYPNGLAVGLDDRTKEKYTPPPPPKYISFSGQGVSLGGPQQQQQQQQQQQSQQKPTKKELNVDESKPTTQIMVRMSNGQQVTLKANLSTTVGELYEHIRGLVGIQNIKLIAGFPPKALSNMNESVEDADLMDSQINQS